MGNHYVAIPQEWYLQIQTILWFLASLLIWLIWKRGLPIQIYKTNRKLAIIWFSIAVLIWGTASLILLLFHNFDPNLLMYVRVYSSTLNSGCILISMMHFDDAYRFLKGEKQRFWGYVSIVLGCFLVFVLTPLLEGENTALADTIFSILTVLVFALIFWNILRKTRIVIIEVSAAAAFFVLLILQVAEIYHLPPEIDQWRWILSLCSKIVVVIMFIFVEWGWIDERVYEEKKTEYLIRFTNKVSFGRKIVFLKRAENQEEFGLTDQVYNALLRFALAKKMGQGGGYISIQQLPGGANTFRYLKEQLNLVKKPELFEELFTHIYGGLYCLTFSPHQIEIDANLPINDSELQVLLERLAYKRVN